MIGSMRLASTEHRLRAAVLRLVSSPRLVWWIAGFAIALRILRYLADRSLWLDESYLVLNLTTRSYEHLTGSLDFNQGAPVGFLFLEKAVLQTLGDSEYALRLPSLIVGVTSVFVFIVVARAYLPRPAVPFALFFFTVIEPFIYYSSEVKQYGFDVLVTLVLLALFARVVDKSLTNRGASLLATLGGLCIWFSHPAVFSLATYTLVAMTLALRRRDTADIARQAAVYAVWLASFTADYLLSVRHLHQLSELAADNNGSTTHQGSYLMGVAKGVYTIFSDPGQQPRTIVGVTAFAAAVGVAALWRHTGPRTALLIGPAIVTVGAGAIHRYPVGVRFILFLLPIGVLLVAAGVVALSRATRGELRLIVAGALGALLLLSPAKMTLEAVANPPDQEPAESLIASVAKQWRPGDVLYLYSTSQYAFRYYLRCADCNGREQSVEQRLWPFRPTKGGAETSPAIVSKGPSLVVGAVGPNGRVPSYVNDLRRLQGHRRVWVLILHVFPATSAQLTQPLAAFGEQLAAVQRGLSFLFLYDLG
jgi:hypothetical protein